MKRFILMSVMLLSLFWLSSVSTLADGTVMNRGVRFANTSPDGPAVDVYIDGGLVYPNVAYTTVSNYSNIPAGNRLIRILPAGSSPNQAPLIPDTQLSFAENRFYTLVLVGRANQLELLLLEDNNSPTPVNKSRVTVIHASPEAITVDVCIVGQPGCFINNLVYKSSQTYDIEQGNYNIDLRLSGTNNVVYNIPNITFRDGYANTCFAMGLLNVGRGVEVKCVPYPTRQDANQDPCLNAPCYPPVTGAFLAPEALALLVTSLMVIGTGAWIVQRQFRN